MRIKDLNKTHCPHCNIPMGIHKTMTGEQFLCDNYNICGQRTPIEEWRKNNEE